MASTSPDLAPADWPLRTIANQLLDDLEVPPRHVDSATAGRHGHPGACCCIMQACRGDACNVNQVLLALVEAQEVDR